VDSRRLIALVPGLMLVRVPGGTDTRKTRENPLPAIYRVLKPFVSTDTQLVRAGLIPRDTRLYLPAELVRRLAAGDTDSCLTDAVRRLRAAGIPIDFRNLAPGATPGRRLLAALMVPIADGDLQQLLPRLGRGEQR
jgi:CRISPR-associated protein Csx17